jgi:hypothetical protein
MPSTSAPRATDPNTRTSDTPGSSKKAMVRARIMELSDRRVPVSQLPGRRFRLLCYAEVRALLGEAALL